MIRNSITAYDGKQISVVEWADVQNPIGIIQISHGMAEHAMRYDYFAKKMNEKGLIVVADDHRAHGYTDRETLGYSKGDIWEGTLQDIKSVCEYAKNKYSQQYERPLGVVLFGHSYGSFLTQAFIRRYPILLSGAIIGGSNYFAGAVLPLGRLLARIRMTFVGPSKPNYLLKKMSFDVYNKNFERGTFISSIESECEKYKEDDMCGFICSSNFYYCFFKGAQKLYKKQGESLKGFNVLLVAGDKDPVGNMGKGIEKLNEWYKQQGASVNCIIYNGVRHEYLNDTSRLQAITDIGAFACDYLRR